MPRLAQLNVFPIKSCAGIALDHAHLGPRGLDLDRHWMLVDERGEAVTLRQLPLLAQVRPSLSGAGLRVSGPGQADLTLPLQESGPAQTVTIFGAPMQAALSEQGSAWFSALAGRRLGLVRLMGETERHLAPRFGTQALSFQDGNPVHLIARESVADLERRLLTPLPPERFRANLIVEGAPAWAEDSWARIQIGEVIFDLYEPSQRCVIVNVPTRGEAATREPLATLARERRTDLGVLFGWNLSHAPGGELHVGDEVRVLEVRESPFAAGQAH